MVSGAALSKGLDILDGNCVDKAWRLLHGQRWMCCQLHAGIQPLMVLLLLLLLLLLLRLRLLLQQLHS